MAYILSARDTSDYFIYHGYNSMGTIPWVCLEDYIKKEGTSLSHMKGSYKATL